MFQILVVEDDAHVRSLLETILTDAGYFCTTAVDGMDALLAIVQMPSGIPVATVAINGAKNGALLAVQIGAASDAELSKKYKAYRENMAQEVMKKNQKLQETVKSL